MGYVRPRADSWLCNEVKMHGIQLRISFWPERDLLLRDIKSCHWCTTPCPDGYWLHYISHGNSAHIMETVICSATPTWILFHELSSYKTPLLKSAQVTRPAIQRYVHPFDDFWNDRPPTFSLTRLWVTVPVYAVQLRSHYWLSVEWCKPRRKQHVESPKKRR